MKIPNHWWREIFLGCWLVLQATAAEVVVGDAYARAGDGRWVIGTGAVEQVFEQRDGQFRLASYLNKLVKPTREYVDPASASAPFALDVDSFAGKPALETIWEKPLKAEATVDPAVDRLSVVVKKGDLIGFRVQHAGPDEVFLDWAASIAYQGGERFASADDKAVDQGPVWFYSLWV